MEETEETEEITQILARIEESEGRVQSWRMDYAAHESLVQDLMEVADKFKENEEADQLLSVTGRLKNSLQRMSSVFPLAEYIWAEWIEIEREEEGADHKQLKAMFERALRDYVSIDLWVRYASFVQEGGEIEKELVIQVYEEAVKEVGCDFSEGHLVWHSYLRYLEELDDVTDEEVRDVFRRCLSIPLAGFNVLFQEYGVWELDEGQNVVSEESRAYITREIEKRSQYEQEIATQFEAGDPLALLEAFRSYIAFEKEASRDPTKIRLLYERALKKLSLTEDLWEEYIAYVDSVRLDETSVLTIAERSTRNCPFSAALLSCYLMHLEKSGADPETISSVVMDSLDKGIQGALSFTKIFANWIGYLIRRPESDEKTIEAVQNAHEFSVSFLEQLEEGFAPAELEFLVINCYFSHNRGDLALKRVKELLKHCWRDISQVLYLVGICREHKMASLVNEIFHTVLFKAIGGEAETVGNYWMKYTSENGGIADIEEVKVQVRKRLMEVGDKTSNYKNRQKGRKGNVGNFAREGAFRNSHKKRKFDERANHRRKNIERRGNERKYIPKSQRVHVVPEKGDSNTETGDVEYEPRTVFIKNLNYNTTPGDLANFFKEGSCDVKVARVVYNRSGASKGIGFVEFNDDDESITAALALDRKELGGRVLSVERSIGSKKVTRRAGKAEPMDYDEKPIVPMSVRRRDKRV